MPSRHFRHDYARLIGFRDYLALDLIAPPAPTANPGANINAAASFRSVNYMVNHICEPIQPRSATSSGSNQLVQDGDRASLTLKMASSTRAWRALFRSPARFAIKHLFVATDYARAFQAREKQSPLAGTPAGFKLLERPFKQS